MEMKLDGRMQSLLNVVKKRKIKWFGHVARSKGMKNTIMFGMVEGCRQRGRPKRQWVDDIKEWTGKSEYQLVRMAESRKNWHDVSNIMHQRPNRLWNK